MNLNKIGVGNRILPTLGVFSAASLMTAVTGYSRGGRAGLVLGTAALAGGVISLFACSGEKAKTQQWEKSESAAQSDEIERYANEGNVGKLDEIGNAARSRSADLSEKIRQAKQSGLKKVDHDGRQVSLKEAEALVVFDKLVAVRADLNKNRLSTDPKSRLGGELPQTWQQRLQEEGGKAQQSQFDGALLLLIDQLEGEVGRDQSVADRLAQEIASFEKAPQTQIQKATADLQGFRTGEVEPERSLSRQYTDLVNQRTHQRLYAGNVDYHTQSDRNQRLSVLSSTLVNPAVEAATYIDSQLGVMIENRRLELLQLAEARSHERVLTTCDRDEEYQVPTGEETDDGVIIHRGGGGDSTPRGEETDDGVIIDRGGRTNRGAPQGQETDDGVIINRGNERSGGTPRGEETDDGVIINRQGMLGGGSLAVPRTITRTRKVKYSCYQDQSEPFKRQAALFAELARAAAQNAQGRINNLQPLIAQLYRDTTIQSEGLGHLLPKGSVRSVNPGHGVTEYVFDSLWFREANDFWSTWRTFNSIDQAQETRSEFRSTLSSLQTLQGAVSAKQSDAGGFVNRTFQADLARQREQARTKTP